MSEVQILSPRPSSSGTKRISPYYRVNYPKGEYAGKISGLFAAALAAVNLLAAKPVATSVTARQRYPWNGKVDIVVTFSGASNDVAEAACVFAATNSATKAALAMAHVTDAGTISGSGATWTRRYVWDAAADLGEVKIADVVLAAEAATPLGGVQLWEGGPYWAECNVGATKPEEYGYYFWWGDTVGYAREGGTWTSDYYYSGVTWVSSTGARMGSSPFSGSSCPTYNKTTAQLQSAGYIDATGNLVAKYDAATAHLGAPWRMPTDAEFAALINNCTTTWTMRNGVYGRLVTGKGGLLDEEHLPSRCRLRHRLLPLRPRLGRLLLVLHAVFGLFQPRVEPLLQFGQFQPEQLRPLLRFPGASSPRICQVARELRARPIHSA